jgi:hypothetical protein
MTDPPPILETRRSTSEDARRRWRRRRRRLRRRIRRLGDVLLVVMVLAVIVIAVQKRSSNSGSNKALGPYAADVKITRCAFNRTLFAPVAHATITNREKSAGTYFVDIVFHDGAKRYAEAVAQSRSLSPTQSATVTASKVASGDAPKQLTCKIANVQKFVADSTPGKSAAELASFADVKRTSCSYSNYAARSHLTITNHTGRTLNYLVTVLFAGDGKLFSTGVASATGLKPKHTVDVIATALSTGPAPKKLACALVSVNRYS